MTTANKLYSSVLAYIIIGGCIVNFGFVPVLVIGGPLFCYYLVWRNTKTLGKPYSRRVELLHEKGQDTHFIRKLFNLKDGK